MGTATQAQYSWKFAAHGYRLTPNGEEVLRSLENASEAIDTILSRLHGDIVDIDELVIEAALSGQLGSVPTITRGLEELEGPTFLTAPTSQVQVLRDITGYSTCTGTYDNFVTLLRNRYATIRKIVAGTIIQTDISDIEKIAPNVEFSIIGMVMERHQSKAGNLVVSIEDLTGMEKVIVMKSSNAFSDAETILTDEVLGMVCSKGRKGGTFVRKIIRPDVPHMKPVVGQGAAAAISDLHVGSNTFVSGAWDRFLAWVNGELEDGGLSEKLKYVVIAGDLVDGVGVYPGQEAELEIRDIYEQYERVGEYLKEIPDSIQVVISPGNHDFVRQAEPQPSLRSELQEIIGKRPNYTYVGSPARVMIGGIEWILYHGRSLDEIMMKIPGVTYAKPAEAMVELLRRRHLSPIYGTRAGVAPEAEDYLMIDRPPAVIHSGHVHTVGFCRYREVTLINSGAWQSQTEFQKKVNLQPTPGIVPYLDMKTMKIRRLIFA